MPPLLRPVRTRSNLVLAGTLLSLAVVLAAVLFLFNPSHYGFYPQCLLFRTTGLQCPGCGSLRALHHLLHGEIGPALRLNALLVLLLPLPAVLAARSWLVSRSASAGRGRARVPQWLFWFVLAATVVFGVLRNTPLAHAIGSA